MIAFGVINYCFKNSIRIPDEISVVGFDNNKFSSLNFISLTTIDEPKKEIGANACEILIQQINSDHKIKIKKLLKPKLIKRNSAKKI